MTNAIQSIIPHLKREAKVIVLHPSLPHFYVGANPSHSQEWANRPTCQVAANMKECYIGFIELATLGIPIIAVMNGKVYGGGLPITLWCNYRIAMEDINIHFGNLS